ncbi:nucleoredoxin-like protein 1 [Carcharodon carcharias]|uniref:nucleoredoxin-like protein 1 n=1 Tax=Carcharodon carcharias TaxID=13397 RepID=UPI001B7E644A|nr:nucleoredoxin-like protein 1 [Carcharodon carcharias]XP_041033287.1 nucleoredoxin-like protein 1 [Carcharodon carcharias]XP_041033288.1 nucleoredoxin-like protein 1 [Carcharodon carcharias]
MADLFDGITLIVNNRDRDQLDTPQQLENKVRNKLVLLYFGSRECPKCQEFAPVLQEFSNRLMDEFYVERAAQLVFVYVSQDQTEEKEQQYLKRLHRKWLYLPFRDKYKRELQKKYNIKVIPSIIVLKPNGDLITRNGVAEISTMGMDCFKNWWEASEVIDRNFLLAEDFEDWTWKSLTDPLRQLKYKIKTGKEKAHDME